MILMGKDRAEGSPARSAGLQPCVVSRDICGLKGRQRRLSNRIVLPTLQAGEHKRLVHRAEALRFVL
jgi:hypothetical protein